MAAHVVLPWTHRVFANLKRWALGVYHGLRRKHLQSYLDEFTFRFNRRRTRHAAFRSLLHIAAAKMPTTYNMLIKPEATNDWVKYSFLNAGDVVEIGAMPSPWKRICGPKDLSLSQRAERPIMITVEWIAASS